MAGVSPEAEQTPGWELGSCTAEGPALGRISGPLGSCDPKASLVP